MASLLLLVTTALAAGPAAEPPRLDGAFIQLDRSSVRWTRDEWNRQLDRMQSARLRIIIVQYTEALWGDDAARTQSFLPPAAGALDPLLAILDHADAHPGTRVFVGLRYVAPLLAGATLNHPARLRRWLSDERPRNADLARRLAADYRLAARPSFAGWYLPLELANYREAAGHGDDGWVEQVRLFTRDLSDECRRRVDRPVAASPYFNGGLAGRPDLVGAEEYGRLFGRYLRGSGLSIVMLQDGVSVRHVPAARVESYVEPYVLAIAGACRAASTPERPVTFWLNVESLGADIGRLETQIKLARKHAPVVVTFDFPHGLGRRPLYDDFLRSIETPAR